MDKASVLGDAIKYMKQLQDRVKMLEEEAAKRESAVPVRRLEIKADDDDYSDDASSNNMGESPSLPEIEAKVRDRNILLKIQCEKRKGVLVRIIEEIEKLNLAVVSTSVTPFGSFALDITIVLEMEEDSRLLVKDVTTSVRSAIDDIA